MIYFIFAILSLSRTNVKKLNVLPCILSYAIIIFNMKVLVTGGAGFIGSHLAERLLDQKDEVWVIDNLSTGRRQNISHLEQREDFTFIYDTILNEKLIGMLVPNCDLIYHLAAAVGVKFIIDNPLKSIQINVRGTEILLEFASKHKKKVILTSSSEVYGKNDKIPLSEDNNRILGSTNIHRWSYSCTKALSEFLALAYHREKGLPMVIARLFNVCGPRQTEAYGMVIPSFVNQALANRPITIYGDGEQVRTFTYITDTIDALVSLNNYSQAIGETFNIGSDQSITILELAKKIKALAKSRSEIIFIPYEKVYGQGFEDMRCRVPDITKISKLTGYTPKVGLDEMLQRVLLLKQRQQSEVYPK